MGTIVLNSLKLRNKVAALQFAPGVLEIRGQTSRIKRQ